MTTSRFHIGERLSFDGALCTVRYIGPVANTEKDWLGVEWDDSSRGKHNGEHKGVRYFQCKSSSKTAASFVRPTRRVDKAQSFVAAVSEKYASEVTKSHNALDLKKEIEISGKVVQEVGFDKIRQQLAQLHELKIVLVDGLRIWKAEDEPKQIREVCPKIIELDLSRNLFENCQEIANICRELQFLRSLRLNGNRLEIDSEHFKAVEGQRNAFSNVTDLSLDDMLIKWEEVCVLIEAFPSMKSLSANANEWLWLNPGPFIKEKFPAAGLTSVTIEYNMFSSLDNLEILVKLSSLQQLHLKGNRIKSVTALAGDKTTRAKVLVFGKQLHYVDLSYNEVDDWAFVDKLPAVFPGLTSLRFAHNPIYEKAFQPGSTTISNDETYMITLARLANLKSLNYSTISALDRQNAEMFYLSQIGKAMALVPKEEEHKVTSLHRRYNELCEIYGAPTVLRAGSLFHKNWLEARLIKFTFYRDLGSGKTATYVKEVPKGFDTYQLRGIAGSLFGLQPRSLILTWETGEWDPVAGYEDEEENDSDDEDQVFDVNQENNKKHNQGKWMKREVELEDSTRHVGNTIDGMEATVRVELLQILQKENVTEAKVN